MSVRSQDPDHPAAGPYVILDVDFVRQAFVLVLANIGQAPAFDPRVTFSRKLVGVGGDVVVSDLPVWSTLTLLRPGKRLDVFLDAASLVFRRKDATEFTATVTYANDAGESFKHRYQHNLAAYRDLPQLEP